MPKKLAAILANARSLRTGMTNAEEFVWYLLRDRRFCGIKFRRQHPFSSYILDFYAPQLRLAIELDGGGHNDPVQQGRDEVRSAALQAAGLRVLRFWNHEVFNDTDAVLTRLHVEIFTAPSPGLPATLSPKGRGAA